MDYSYIPDAQSQPFSMYGLHGLPTPEQSRTTRPDLQDTFSLNGYNPFDPSLQFDPSAFAAPPHSPESLIKQAISNNDPHKPTDQIPDDGADEHIPVRSSSEEKEGAAVPAPSRRKEQNRAAQRAFRERKERHVKDLEEKALSLEKTTHSLRTENERLRHELEKYKAENEILRATSDSLRQSTTPKDAEPATTAPMKFTPNDFIAQVVPEGHGYHASPSHRVVVCQSTGEKLLDASATWDFIQAHELFRRGLVDIAVVCEKLKSKVQCGGQGPVFAEGNVRWAIEESAAGGSDELI